MTGPHRDHQGDSVEESAPLDRVLDSIGDRRLREVIDYCRRNPGEVMYVEELADHVVERRRRAGDEVDRNVVIARLHHLHLPKLAANGVVEFDHRSGKVRYLPDDRLERWLDRVQAE